MLDVQKSIGHKKTERLSRLDSDACAIRIVRSGCSRKTVSVWSDAPAVSKSGERSESIDRGLRLATKIRWCHIRSRY
ncbi:hypothetical protein N5J07_17850, partial [Comamonas aquatica]|uniref:hypothetical protein n=1 Tax=Comamonas aquatica TaxID=225991 RepID=UPI00244AFAFA